MNELKKCPHCGQDAHIQINITNSYVDVQLLCNGCDAIFKCSEHLGKDGNILKAVNECFIDVLERWNTRVEERKES